MPPPITIDVIGTPAPQGSKTAGTTKTGRPFVRDKNPATLRTWRTNVATAARNAHRHDPDGWLHDGPLTVRIAFYMPRPRGHYRTGRYSHLLRDGMPTHCAVRPDIDKLARAVLDALVDSNLIRDDSQIVELHLTQRYGNPVAGARITITPLTVAAPAEGEANGAATPTTGATP